MSEHVKQLVSPSRLVSRSTSLQQRQWEANVGSTMLNRQKSVSLATIIMTSHELLQVVVRIRLKYRINFTIACAHFLANFIQPIDMDVPDECDNVNRIKLYCVYKNCPLKQQF